VTNNFSYFSSVTTMLDHLKWPLLEQRRNYLKLIMLYKILHEVPISLTPLSSSTRGHSQLFITPFARTETYLHSFLLSTITLWNSLPSSLFNYILTYSKMTYILTFSLLINCVYDYLCVIYITLSCEFYTVKTINK